MKPVIGSPSSPRARRPRGPWKTSAKPRRARRCPLVASYTRTNHVEEFGVPNASGGVRVIYPDIPDNVRSRVDLQWPIYTGGRLQALTRAAGAEADAAARTAKRRGRISSWKSRAPTGRSITARASHDVVTQALERTNAHLVDVRNQLNVGLVPPSDVLSIEAQQARQQMLLIEAENIVETASADFRRLTGLDPDAPFELVDGRPRSADGRSPAQPGFAQSPPHSAAVVRLTRARQSARAEGAGVSHRCGCASASPRRPPAACRCSTAIGGYDFARPNPRIFPIQKAWKPSWDLGVNVRWPRLRRRARPRGSRGGRRQPARRRGAPARLRLEHRSGDPPACRRASFGAGVNRSRAGRRACRRRGAPSARGAVRGGRRDQHRRADGAGRAAAGRARSSRARSPTLSSPPRGSTGRMGR